MKIFISYRREDSQHVTGRIYDQLVAHFGPDEVFKDVDSIPFGIDFRVHLKSVIGACQAVLVVIGDNWLQIQDEKRRRRLTSPQDFVRIEIEAALDRNIPVIPVLVGKVGMPREQDLPPTLAPLAYRNGIQVRPDPDFHRDMERLINRMKRHLDELNSGAAPVSLEKKRAPVTPVVDAAQSRVTKLQTIAQRLELNLKSIVSGQQKLAALARDLAQLPNRYRGSVTDTEFLRRLETMKIIVDLMMAAMDHVTHFSNFLTYADPRIGIGPGNVNEVLRHYESMKAEAQGQATWAAEILNALKRETWLPAQISQTMINLVNQIRADVNVVRTESKRVGPI